MAVSLKGIVGRWLERKSTGPDWGVLERYLAWAFGAGASASGIIVNPQTAMQQATVYACIRALSQPVGMLPCNVLRDSGDGGRDPARDHPLFEILRYQPNDFQSSVEFFEMMVAALLLRGNAYAFVNRTSSGDVAELLPLHPDMVRTEMTAGFRLVYQVTMPDGSFKEMVPGEIMHVRGLTLNGWLGISPIAYAREAIGLSLATEKFGGQLFRNGAKMSGVLEHPGKLSDIAYNRIKESFDAATSGENVHKTQILEEGIKYSKISLQPDDAQFLETRKYQRTEICAVFGVPPHLAGDLERATFSNIEQQSLDFLTNGVMPLLNRIEKAARRDLLTRDERKKLHIKFSVAPLLRGDAAARSMYYHNGILDGWLTRANARAMEAELGYALNPIPGLDEPLVPLNMSELGDDPEDAGGDAGGGDAQGTKALLAAVTALAATKTSAPVIHLNVPERKTEIALTVPERSVLVKMGDVNVDVPERDVHVDVAGATVNVPERQTALTVNGFPAETEEIMERDEGGELKRIVRRVVNQ